MNLDNVYSFTVSRQNSSEVAPGKSPCVKIKFIKDESIARPAASRPKTTGGLENISEKNSVSDDDRPDLGPDDVSGSSPLSICPIYEREYNSSDNLRTLLNELFKLVQKKDSHMIFAYPVTEEQAPNYSSMIDHPMDLQTIRYKIDSGSYRCVTDIAEDLVLMCQNALTYNTPDTFYYKFAAQMLNYVKKIFSKETLNKFVVTKLNWDRNITDEETGDWSSCQTRIKIIQNEITKSMSSSRPQRSLQRHYLHDVIGGGKRKSDVDVHLSTPKKHCYSALSDSVAHSERSESEIDDNCSNNLTSELSDGDDDGDSNVISDVLLNAQKAAAMAKQRLEQVRRLPVVFLDQIGDDISVIDYHTRQKYPMENEFQSMVTRIGSANIEQMIGENERVLSQLSQLCHDANESVALTTSKPLEPYSCAEQAVLVETFGDVVTAEFACNMHNFVLDLPPNSPAVEAVKNKLNTATNYLTYGVDQIIIKKLKAGSTEVSRN